MRLMSLTCQGPMSSSNAGFVRGTMAIVFGVLAFTLTVTTLATLILAFGLYVLADGLFAIAAAIASRTRTGYWWVLLLQGVLGVGVGVATLRYPDLTAVVLLWYVAAWAVVLGRSNPAATEAHLDRCAAEGVPVLRRSSGGGTVLIGPGSLAYSLVMPLSDELRAAGVVGLT